MLLIIILVLLLLLLISFDPPLKVNFCKIVLYWIIIITLLILTFISLSFLLYNICPLNVIYFDSAVNYDLEALSLNKLKVDLGDCKDLLKDNLTVDSGNLPCIDLPIDNLTVDSGNLQSKNILEDYRLKKKSLSPYNFRGSRSWLMESLEKGVEYKQYESWKPTPLIKNYSSFSTWVCHIYVSLTKYKIFNILIGKHSLFLIFVAIFHKCMLSPFNLRPTDNFVYDYDNIIALIQRLIREGNYEDLFNLIMWCFTHLSWDLIVRILEFLVYNYRPNINSPYYDIFADYLWRTLVFRLLQENLQNCIRHIFYLLIRNNRDRSVFDMFLLALNALNINHQFYGDMLYWVFNEAFEENVENLNRELLAIFEIYVDLLNRNGNLQNKITRYRDLWVPLYHAPDRLDNIRTNIDRLIMIRRNYSIFIEHNSVNTLLIARNNDGQGFIYYRYNHMLNLFYTLLVRIGFGDIPINSNDIRICTITARAYFPDIPPRFVSTREAYPLQLYLDFLHWYIETHINN